MEGLQMMIMNWTVNNKGHLTCGWNSLTEGRKVVADPKRIVVNTCGKVTYLKTAETLRKITKNALVAIA
jgi:hypothetical protein